MVLRKLGLSQWIGAGCGTNSLRESVNVYTCAGSSAATSRSSRCYLLFGALAGRLAGRQVTWRAVVNSRFSSMCLGVCPWAQTWWLSCFGSRERSAVYKWVYGFVTSLTVICYLNICLLAVRSGAVDTKSCRFMWSVQIFPYSTDGVFCLWILKLPYQFQGNERGCMFERVKC